VDAFALTVTLLHTRINLIVRVITGIGTVWDGMPYWQFFGRRETTLPPFMRNTMPVCRRTNTCHDACLIIWKRHESPIFNWEYKRNQLLGSLRPDPVGSSQCRFWGGDTQDREETQTQGRV